MVLANIPQPPDHYAPRTGEAGKYRRRSMTTFIFTDNKALHKSTLRLSPAELAEHLAKDRQFVYYFSKGWDSHLAATRSLAMYPVDPKATVPPNFSTDQWAEVELAVKHLLQQ